jgi:hypothetical protein
MLDLEGQRVLLAVGSGLVFVRGIWSLIHAVLVE